MMTRRALLLSAAAAAATGQSRPAFAWPNGKQAAVSLTFDDARLSQIDVGLGILDKLKLKATFYVSPERMLDRLDGWKAAVKAGHEIANHSYSHPCTANYAFSAANALEDYTLARIGADLDRANDAIAQSLGVKPVSFAYPCGQKFVGRGESARSYVPEVAKRFLSGRGYLDEAANDPLVCDLAALMGTGMDGLTVAQLEPLVKTAVQQGRWIVLVGHEMGKRAYQSTGTEELAWVSEYASSSENRVWLATVEQVARHVAGQRRSRKEK